MKHRITTVAALVLIATTVTACGSAPGEATGTSGATHAQDSRVQGADRKVVDKDPDYGQVVKFCDSDNGVVIYRLGMYGVQAVPNACPVAPGVKKDPSKGRVVVDDDKDYGQVVKFCDPANGTLVYRNTMRGLAVVPGAPECAAH